MNGTNAMPALSSHSDRDPDRYTNRHPARCEQIVDRGLAGVIHDVGTRQQ